MPKYINYPSCELERDEKFLADFTLTKPSGGRFGRENKGFKETEKEAFCKICLEGHFGSKVESGLRE